MGKTLILKRSPTAPKRTPIGKTVTFTKKALYKKTKGSRYA